MLEIFLESVMVIVVYRKIQVKENTFETLNIDNVAVEVTLLGEFGEVMREYEEALFTLISVHY